MKNNKTKFRLVARLAGDTLTIDQAVVNKLAALYDRRVEHLYRDERGADRRAYLVSVELERKGDFLWACGHHLAAVRAYVQAARLALDGDYYDAGRKQQPAAALRHRSRELVRKINRCAAADPRLAELVKADRSFTLLTADQADEW